VEVIQHKGIWLPDNEEHLVMMLDKMPMVNGRGAYQYKKYLCVMAWVNERRTVIDVGAHVGLWSMHFVKEFNQLEAFEPCVEHRRCFIQNMEDQIVGDNWFLHSAACGDRMGSVRMKTDSTSSGDTYPNPDESNEEGEKVLLVRIDDFDFQGVNLIKLDCEGYELLALQGAEATIKRCHPTIIVEQKPQKAQKFGLKETQAVTYLEGLGMRCARVLSGDYIMVW